MVNEKETRTPECLRRPSQMCENGCMRKTVQGIQKFEFPALFLHRGKKSACRAETAENGGKTIRPLVSEKAQDARRSDLRTVIAASDHRKHRMDDILNDCSMPPARSTSLQAPAT
jgi:hypothetical protein